MLFTDKTYLQTTNRMLFNVTGYRHPDNHVYAALKYVDGQKWTQGYEAAKAFLAREYPEFVDQFIRVPKTEITKHYVPQVRWTELKQAPSLPPLLAQAVQLGDRLRELLQIPISNGVTDSEMGITDSLLWGEGHEQSDIDLVVVGDANAQRILDRGVAIYDDSDFSRPDPNVMKAPYSLDVPQWPAILARKLHMGSYQGRLFSLRAIRNVQPNQLPTRELPQRFTSDYLPKQNRKLVEFQIADASQSLYFPAIYRNADGDELVDYSVVYEGVFRPGDVVQGECNVESVAMENVASGERSQVIRNVIEGSCTIIHAAKP